jgi:hypothetical protein
MRFLPVEKAKSNLEFRFLFNEIGQNLALWHCFEKRVFFGVKAIACYHISLHTVKEFSKRCHNARFCPISLIKKRNSKLDFAFSTGKNRIEFHGTYHEL